VGFVLVSIVGLAWSISADREFRHKMPEQGRFFPSRLYVTPDREGRAKSHSDPGYIANATQLEQANH
jgi:hypothetical protein